MRITLKAARVNADYKQQTASEKLGISNKTLYSWENGITIPQPKYIPKIEHLYNVDYDDIVFFKKQTRLYRNKQRIKKETTE